MIQGFWTSLGLLTRIPIPEKYTTLPATQPLWFPVVGILIGTALGFLHSIFALLFAPSVAVMLTIGFGFWLTGGMHEDGVADVADAMGGATIEKRREILKDSRVGTFGVLALMFFIILKSMLLTEMFIWVQKGTVFVWAIAGAWSRWMPLLVLRKCDYLFSAGKGLGAELKPPNAWWVMLQWAVLVSLTYLLMGPQAAKIIGICSLYFAHVLAPRCFNRWFGGINGDGCGVVNAVGEILFLLAVLLSMHQAIRNGPLL